jgi:hypothetical protein
MTIKAAVRISTDILLVALLLVQMAYMRIGLQGHEWIGVAMIVLIILHNILNRAWYANLFKGTYSPVRILQTTINILMLLSILGLAVSGIILSQYVFGFLNISGVASFARTLHLLSAYWGFIFMSLHLGLHWDMIVRMIQKAFPPRRTTAAGKVISVVVAVLAALYGLFAFIKHDIGSYLFLQTMFVFFDMEEPLLLFFTEYLAIMGLFVFAAHYMKKLFFLRQAFRKK